MKRLIAVTVIAAMLFTISANAFDLVTPEDPHIETTTVQIIDGEEFSVTTYTPVQDTKKTIYESETSIVIGEYSGLNYTITEIQKDEHGNLIPESQVVYSGTYTDPTQVEDTQNSEVIPYSPVAHGGSQYFKGDQWYSYAFEEWHLYYGDVLADTGSYPGTTIVNLCNNYRYAIIDADKAVTQLAISAVRATVEGLTPGGAIAGIVMNLIEGDLISASKAVITAFLSENPYFKGLTLMITVADFVVEITDTATLHEKYHNIWKDVKKRVS